MEQVNEKHNDLSLDLQKLIVANKQLRNENSNYKNMIESNNCLIKENEKIIWNKCQHVWERDYDVAFDDHIKYFCSKCGLWNNAYMYK